MGLENFPNEILEKILQDRCLSYVDVSRFSRVCRRFREIGESEETWRGKFWQAWPRLPAQLPRARLPATNWRGESQKRVQHGRAVRQELSNFSQRFFSRAELSSADFPFFDDLLLQYNPDRNDPNPSIARTILSLIVLIFSFFLIWVLNHWKRLRVEGLSYTCIYWTSCSSVLGVMT